MARSHELGLDQLAIVDTIQGVGRPTAIAAGAVIQ
jgi:hypothetical protein